MAIVEVNTFLKNKAKGNQADLDIALECLNTLVNQGMEYPNAEYHVLKHFSVEQAELIRAYDAI